MLKILQQAIKHNKLAQAYLFVGRNLFGQAREFAFKITKSKFDIHIFEPEDGSLKIEQVRKIQQKLSLKPYQGKRQVALVKQAHLLTIDAGNAFLKILEEPPGNNVIILLSYFKYLLLPTIISRCQIVHFPLKKQDKLTKPNKLSEKNLEEWLLWKRDLMLKNPNKKTLENLTQFFKIYCAQQKLNLNQKLIINYLNFYI